MTVQESIFSTAASAICVPCAAYIVHKNTTASIANTADCIKIPYTFILGLYLNTLSHFSCLIHTHLKTYPA